LDAERLADAMSKVTREKVKEKTIVDDPKVIKQGAKYEKTRATFRQTHANLVWDVVLENCPTVKQDFA
jgi:hypothetical protein